MANKIPLKTKAVGSGVAGLSQFEPTDTVAIEHGGTAADNAVDALTNLGATPLISHTAHTGNTSNPHSVTTAQISAINQSEKGIVNGVAELDSGGKVPIAQIPATAIPSMSVVADATARLALTVQEGDEAKQLDDGSHWIYDGTTWHLYPSGSSSVIFGTEFQKAEDASVQTTTSSGFQTALTYNTASLPTGEYRVGLSYMWNYNGTTTDFECDILLNSSSLGEIHKAEPPDAGSSWGSTGTSQRYPVYRLYYETLSGVNQFEVKYRTNSGGIEASIWQIILEIWRVS